MNEQQMVALVERTGEALEPDVARLVAGSFARGRVRRVRRRLAAAVGVSASVAAAVVAAPLLDLSGGTPGPAAGTAETPRQLVVAPEDMSGTLATLLPGSRVVADEAPYQFQVQRGSVRWHGVTITVAIDTRGVDVSTPARERCEAFAGAAYCEPAPRGAWVQAGGTLALDASTGEMGPLVSVTRVYVPGGYLIEASAESRLQVSRDRLRRIALDDIWWR